MTFKEAYCDGIKVAETVYQESSRFERANDPQLDKALEEKGIKRSDIDKLGINLLRLNRENIGIAAASVVFFVSRGGILWNSRDQHR